MHIICLTNIKGGVLKSTNTINIGYGLARKGKRVLIVDMDPQANTTYTLTGRLDEDTENTLYEVLIPQRDAKSITEIIQPTNHENLFLAPGSIWLSSADIELVNRTSREKVLSKALRGLTGYDYVLIDTQPSLGLLTINSMVAATDLIIPITLTIYGLLGIKLLMMSVNGLRENMELDLPILGVIACLGDETNNSRTRLEQVREYFEDKVFETIIPRNIKVEESNDERISLYEFAPNSKGAIAYTKLVEEVIARANP